MKVKGQERKGKRYKRGKGKWKRQGKGKVKETRDNTGKRQSHHTWEKNRMSEKTRQKS